MQQEGLNVVGVGEMAVPDNQEEFKGEPAYGNPVLPQSQLGYMPQ